MPAISSTVAIPADQCKPPVGYETGKKYGDTELLAFLGRTKDSRPRVKVRCPCGRAYETLFFSISTGNTKTCGCCNVENRDQFGFKHGQTNSKATMNSMYKIWQSMKNRCNCPGNTRFASYGGRGIKVCDRWQNSFEAFLYDMGPRPKGKSLERNNNDRGYEPDNCRWATRIEQQNNHRGNRMVIINNETMTVIQAARKFGWKAGTFRNRIQPCSAGQTVRFKGVEIKVVRDRLVYKIK